MAAEKGACQWSSLTKVPNPNPNPRFRPMPRPNRPSPNRPRPTRPSLSPSRPRPTSPSPSRPGLVGLLAIALPLVGLGLLSSNKLPVLDHFRF